MTRPSNVWDIRVVEGQAEVSAEGLRKREIWVGVSLTDIIGLKDFSCRGHSWWQHACRSWWSGNSGDPIMEHSLQGQNHGKEGISESPAIYCFPLKISFDIERPDYTQSV